MKKLFITIVLILMSVVSLSAFTGQVLLDHVEGVWFDGENYKIIPGSPVEFHIRLINNDSRNETPLTNGFSITSSIGGASVVGTSIFPPLYTFINNYGDITGFRVNCVSCVPPGFNDIAFILYTGNFTEGDVVCLDSAFFSTDGTWMWATGPPSWDGPHCFVVETPTTPCYPPVFDYCPDSLEIFNCFYSYEFLATNDSSDNSTIRYSVEEGPGTIYEPNGHWSYTPLPSDYGTTQTLTIKTYNTNCPTNFSLCTTILTFTDSLVIGDINFDCFIDIADLVYMVAFMFQGGPEPPNFDSFDVNGDGSFDVGDLVYLVAYMFAGGPPPVG